MKKSYTEGLPERLKQARRDARKTQAELGNIIKTAKQNIAAYEQGRAEPNLDMLDRIAEALSVELIWLVNGRTSHELDKAADSMFIRKARELMPVEFGMIDKLKQAGFDTEEKLDRLLEMSRSVRIAAEGMATYNKKKGAKR